MVPVALVQAIKTLKRPALGADAFWVLIRKIEDKGTR